MQGNGKSAFLKQKKLDHANEQELLQRLLNSFSAATKMSVALTDIDGEIILKSAQPDCDFCKIIRAHPQGRECCKGSYARAGNQAGKWNEPYFFRCHAGLVSWVCRVESSSMHVGNLICGQVSIWEPDKLFLLEVEEVARSLGIESAVLLDAVKKMEVISAKQVQATADLLFIISKYITQSGVGDFRNQQELREIGSWFWMINSDYHENDSAGYSQMAAFKSYELRDIMLRELTKGNIDEARKLIRQIAFKYFIESKGQIDVIKGLCIELITSLARVATERGVKFEDSFRFDTLRMNELEGSETVDKVLFWLLAVSNSYLDMMVSKEVEPNDLIVGRVKDYISEHYSSNDLTLENIASSNYFSEDYLNKLFKKYTGKTIMEYVIDVRIDQAKKLLKKSNKPIKEIVERVGYSDRSYFSRSFKKAVGISPSEYRRMNLV